MANLHESPFIFGLHDPGGEQIMADEGRKGWVLFTEAIGSDPNDPSGVDYRRWSDAGFGVIVRLNNGYNPGGTIPFPREYENFALRCANFVRGSQGAAIWIIGNEMNYQVEWPGAYSIRREIPGTRDIDADPEVIYGQLRELHQRFNALHPELPESRDVDRGEPITPDKYARCYTLCRNAIRAVPGHGDDQVLIGSVAPWNVDTKYRENPTGDWVQYLTDLLNHLGPNGCDGITIHTYTHGVDPNLIHDESRMQHPFSHRYYNFFTYRDFMHGIPANMRHLPVYLTETDQDERWEDANRGWVKRAYAEIDWWNRQPGHQQIRAAILYRWKPADKWVIQGINGVINDFREALRNDYRWKAMPTPVVSPPPPVVGTPPKPLVAADFKRGERIFTVAVVNLRQTPGVTGKTAEDIVASLPFNSSVRVVDGPRLGDNFVWWLLTAQHDGRTVQGWSAQSLADDQPLLSREEIQVGDFKAQDIISTLTMVRLRKTPGFQGKPAEDVIADLPLDVRATVLTGPRAVDGLTWWQVQTRFAGQEVTGWLAQTSGNGAPLVTKVGASPTPVAPPAPVEPPTPTPSTPTGKFRPNQLVYTGSYVNLRRTPGYVGKTTDDILVEIPYGGAVTIISGPRSGDELTWWQVDFTHESQRLRGWTAEATSNGEELLLEKAPPPPAPAQPPVFDTYRIGDGVCNISLSDVNIRRTPGFRNKPIDDVVALVPSKALLRLKDGPRQADGLFWWQVQGGDSGSPLVGWMAEVSPTGTRLLAPAIFRNAIQLAIPFRGTHAVSQLWGDNADFYKQFLYDGVPLRGHNGIDFGMPVGTPLVSSDEGRVLTVGASPSGFGNWVMVDHRWGQSVYAHMHRVTVREGESVRRGDVLGESGNSGTSTGPHLHFSIRITPHFRGDGWGGYCDPLPFMEVEKLVIPAGIRGEDPTEAAMPPSAPPIEAPGRRLP